MAAADITWDFIRRLKENGEEAQGFFDPRWYEVAGGLVGAGAAAYRALSTFKQKVQAKGPWDFKAHAAPTGYKDYKDTGVKVAGREYRYDMPGNFHYGFVGSAAGIPDWLLFKAAGDAQISAGTSKPEYHCTNYDDPEDHEFIRLGIKLYDQQELDVMEAHLNHVLGMFQTVVCGPKPEKEWLHNRF